MDSLHKRKSNRLSEYDYSQNGMYHITICTEKHKKILSEITYDSVGAIINRPQIKLTQIGELADDAINNIPLVYDNISIEKYVIMPNHIHLLLSISSPIENGRLIIAPTVSRIIKQMKSYVSKQVGNSIWPKGFYDHIIKDDNDLESTWIYIDENPIKWKNDEYY